MGFAEKYINKNIGFPPFFNVPPEKGVGIIVVIPCYNEPDFPDTLMSLASCDLPDCLIEVIVVINSPENSGEEVVQQNFETSKWIAENAQLFPSWLKVFVINADNLNRKWAGVGWGRKIGMDEAVRRYKVLQNPDGIIVSLDADTLVETNYFRAIDEYYKRNPEDQFATINFEHQYQNEKLSNYLSYGIVAYELYMRYYRHALEWTGFPHALYTVGSAFTVKAGAYVKQGGMNRKKAGEDFYFLQKLVPLGDYGEIVSTTVYPSCRLSNRVPFGTGPMLQAWVNAEKDLTLAYDFQAFRELKAFFDKVSELYQISFEDYYILLNGLPGGIRSFLLQQPTFFDALSELSSNCSDISVFNKRFWHFFNAFIILKYLNFVHNNFFELLPLAGSVNLLLSELGVKVDLQNEADLRNYLEVFRKIDTKLIK